MITRYYLRAVILQNSEFLTNIILTCNESKQMGQEGSLRQIFNLVFKPYQIALTPARKPHRTGLLITHKNGDFGAISVTERSLAIWFNHSLSRAST